jgi:protein phosphatase
LRKGKLEQLTKDHTFVQELIEDGSLTLEQARAHPLRNMLDQCVGCGSLKPDTGKVRLKQGDRLLVCSDGLTKHVGDKTIGEVLGRGEVRDAVQELLQLALDAGGKDNVTVVAWENKE